MKSDTLTLAEIQARGCAALARELGPVDYVRFMQQFSCGQGDYSKERRAWVDTLTLEQIRAGIDAQRTKRTASRRRKHKRS